MGRLPLLDELAIIAALAVVVTVILSRLKPPTVAGLLAAGALLGPFGFRLVHSVHAIVLRALTERRELDAPHGRFIVGALIFQDLCVIPMVLVVPLLGGRSPAGAAAVGIGLAMLKAVGVIIATIVIARFVVPKILDWVDASRSREVFLLAILAL